MIDLEAISEKEFLDYVAKEYFDSDNCGKYPLEVRFSVVRQLMKIYKYVENRQQIAYILANRHRVVTEACAGAGKTAISLLKVFTHLMFEDVEPGSVILLSYTRDSANDLRNKFKSMYDRLAQVNLGPLVKTDKIVIKTMHSFFKELIYEYTDLVGLKVVRGNFVVIEENECIFLIRDSITALINKGKINTELFDSLPRRLHSLYAQIKEKDIMNEPAKWVLCSEYKQVKDVNVNDIKQIYEVYEKVKRHRKVIELCEFANFAQDIFHNKDCLKRWQRIYRMVLVDEFQDITQAQVNVLKMIFNEDNPDSYLFAIGDGDQAIYGFRGAHSNGCYNFPTDFGIAGQPIARCYMSLNRRCPSEILDTASKIIETLHIRNYKPLISMKQGGNVSIKEVRDYNQELTTVMDIVNNMSSDEMSNTVIAYRNNRSARMIKYALENAGICVKTNSSIVDLFEISLTNCLKTLADPYNIDLAIKNMYKLLPKSKSMTSKDLISVYVKEKEHREKGYPMRSIFELDYSWLARPDGFDSALQTLTGMSNALRQELSKKHENLFYMDKIVPVLVFDFLGKYYLKWQDKKNDIEGGKHIFSEDGNSIADEYSQMIYRYYTRHVTWNDFNREEQQKQQRLQNSYRTINMSTFHSLKGLEYENVILIALQDSIFPGYELSEAEKFGKHFVIEADDEAKRLFYVAITRSKQNLWLIFNSEEPTRYKSFLDNNSGIDSTNEFDFDSLDYVEEEIQESELDEEVPFDIEESQNDAPQDMRNSLLDRWFNS